MWALIDFADGPTGGGPWQSVSTHVERVLAGGIIGVADGLSRGRRRIVGIRRRGAAAVLPLVRHLGPGGEAVTLAGPCAEVDVLAAFAAERTEGVLGRVDAFATAGGAGDDAALGARLGCRRAHEHKVSSKLASTPAGLRRPSASCRIRRTSTIRRWPLISGISWWAGSMRRRSRWKTRPAGRLCWNCPPWVTTLCGAPASRNRPSSTLSASASGISVPTHWLRSARRRAGSCCCQA